MERRRVALLPLVTFAAQTRKLFMYMQSKQWQKSTAAVPPIKLANANFLAEAGTKPSLLNRLTGSVLGECAKEPENFHDLMEILSAYSSAYSKERSFVFDLGEFLKSNGWIETRFIASRMYVKITTCGLAHRQTTTTITTTGE